MSGLLVPTRAGWQERSLENPNTPLSDPAQWLVDLYGGPMTSAGVRVSPSTALATSATVLAAVSAIAKPLSMLPLQLFEQTGEREKRKATDHPIYSLLAYRPHPLISSIKFRETLEAHALTWGNGYAFISFGQDGRAETLIPLLPDRTMVQKQGARVRYQTIVDENRSVLLEPGEVLHIRGLGYDGLCGYSPISLLRDTIGQGVAAREYASRLYSRGSIGGVLKHPARFQGPEQREEFRRAWENVYGGLNNSGKTAILEQGMDFQPIGMPATDAQLIENRKITREDIGAAYGVPLHMLGDEGTSTYSNAEQFGRAFVTYTLGHWLTTWEQELNYKLLLDRERETYFFKHNVDALLRGDTEKRYSSYRTAIESGFMTRNEARELEDLDATDPQLDKMLTPLNFVTVGAASPGPAAPKPAQRFSRLAREAADRIVKREAKVIGKLAADHATAPAAFAAGFATFIRDHRDYVRAQVEPICEAMGVDAAPFVRRHLERLLNLDTSRLDAELDEWRGEEFRFANALLHGDDHDRQSD